MKPRKKKPAATECGMSGADAQAAYEQTLSAGAKGGAPRAKDLADHIAGCGPCSSALYALELQGDAVSTLAGKSRDAAGGAGGSSASGGTAIESILRVAARSGTSKLADLAYELVKACLIRLPNLERRVRRVVEPREAKIVAGELRKVNERQGGGASGAASVKLTGVPTEAPAEVDALRAATSCLKILEQVEGASPRQVLGMSQVHIFEKRPEKAETLLRGLLGQAIPPQMKSYAYINLLLSLNRQAKYAEVVAVGEEVLLQKSTNWEVPYNLAVAHAYLKNRRKFESFASQLAGLVSSSPSGPLRELLEFETPFFASELSEDPKQVARQFGILPARRSRRHAS